MIRLSICIPTYNFGDFIGQTLDSLLPQITEEVEVIVLDGGSTDNTAEVVTIRQKKYKQLTYYYQDFRGGIDRDIEKAVSLAQGTYCWLFSADDIMLSSAIDKLLEAIKSNNDIYICEHVLCNFEMKPIREHPPFIKLSAPRAFDLSDDFQRTEYFRLARTSEAFFSFLAGPIFKKELWDKVSVPESFRGTYWIVAGHLLSAFSEGISVKYLNEIFIHKRGDNDSFSHAGLVNRIKISIENFQHIASITFGKNSKEAFHIRRVLQNDIPLRYLLMAKHRATENPEKESINLLKQLASIHYIDSTFRNKMNIMLFNAAHPFVLKLAYILKQMLRKSVN